MKTILTRCKTLVSNNAVAGGTLQYVKDTEVIHPEIALTAITIASLPKICFVPVSTVEEWVASGRKQATNIVDAHLILMYHQRESSIMGDSSRPNGQGAGIVDFVADFISVFRGTRFSTGGSEYLSKPLDINGVEYTVQDLEETGQLLLATVTMECVKLLDQFTLPGNI